MFYSTKRFAGLLLLNFLLFSNAFAQTLTQTVRGEVRDISTRETLPGATVTVINSDPIMGTATDGNGKFHLKGVPLGRQAFSINYVGYESLIISEVLVTTGKEVILEIELTQMSMQIDEVVVRAKHRKDKPINSMATLSAKMFTVEETRRYAGGMDDPARLVSAFAGVSVGNVQNNAIIVRGNSPKGVSWRLEGVDIPAPHHFSNINVVGGGLVTILSSHILGNSDFFSGAFPSEYGNAIAGVFDMNLRNGNQQTHEHAVQVGIMGIDLASEGPLGPGKNATYLFNYRYSTFGLLTDMKLIDINNATFRYQDLSFKINYSTQKHGSFSLWATGGADGLSDPHEPKSDLWIQDWDKVNGDVKYLVGAVGFTHKLTLSNRTFISTTVAATGINNKMDVIRLDDSFDLKPDFLSNEANTTLNFNTNFTTKFSSKHALKYGLSHRVMMYNIEVNSTFNQQPNSYQSIVNQNGNSSYSHMFVQSKFNLLPNLNLNSGVNGSYFALNGGYSIEPRIGLNWQVHSKHSVSIGYGLHSQLEDLRIYMVNKQVNSTLLTPNKNLKPTKAHHIIFAYDWFVSPKLRIKVEPYYQKLFDVPGTLSGTYSVINFTEDRAFSKQLVNNGEGKNIGIDFTLERFLSNNYYYLFTASVFDSKYKAADNIWRNSRYNKGYVVNVLAGKEFFFSNNKRVLGLNARVNLMGGERVTPVFYDESALLQKVIFDEANAFSNQLPSLNYIDISVSYRVSKAKVSSVWALQLKNVLSAPIYEGYDYNYKTQRVEMFKSQGSTVIPSLSYKLEF